MSVKADEIVKEVAPDELPAEAPPESANYRDPDVAGICCQYCSHFNFDTFDESTMIASGTCGLYEAKVRGDKVSDGFKSSSAPLDSDGEPVYDYSQAQEFFMPKLEDTIELSQEDNLVWKEILRTGEWAITPTAAGAIKRPMRIIGDGVSDSAQGIIALSDVEQAFADKAVPNVQVVLSDEEKKDHKDTARVNTGFVKALRRVKKGEGDERLVAGIHFTEPEVKEKVLRGTYADISSGILPWIHKRTGKAYRAAMKHAAITNVPWIDGLDGYKEAYNFAQEDGATDIKEVVSYQPAETVAEWNDNSSFTVRKEKIQAALKEQLGLADHYEVVDIGDKSAIVSNTIAEMTWIAPYSVKDDGGISVSDAAAWVAKEDKQENDNSSESKKEEPEPPADAAPQADPEKVSGKTSGGEKLAALMSQSDSDIEAARAVRRLRMAGTGSESGGTAMSDKTDDPLAGLELSQEARDIFQRQQDEIAQLKSTTRESDVEARVTELSQGPLKMAPGALKLYRTAMLNDDGSPAVILLSQEGGKQVKEEIKAIELLDRFIEALPFDNDKFRAMFSDQGEETGNHDKPPDKPDNKDERSEDERTDSMYEALGEKPPAAATA